jgi:hypothetical protein
MAIKLIATDMDGTFLDKNSQFDAERLKNLLEMAAEKGIYFVVASGRAVQSLKSLFAEFKDQVIFLGENGSEVEYRGKTLYEELMPKKLYLEILEKIKKSHFKNADTVHLSGKNAAYMLSSIDDEYRAFLEHYYPTIVEVENFESIEDEIFKLGANFAADQVFEASQWLTQEIEGVVSMTSGYECLDVMLDHVNKGTGLSHLCEVLGISASEVIAFGDNYNDEHMLHFAGTAVAPENAVPEIKELANLIIADHDTGSVMAYMEEIVCQSN